MNTLLRISLVSLMASASATITPACAQDYPNKTVRILAGSPGTLMDVVARHVAHGLSERWGQPVIVENRGGAGFTIGTGAAAQAAPDGYTLVMSDRTALAAAPHLYKSITYDPLKDFAPITLAAVAPLVMVAHPSVPAATLREFIDYARKNPAMHFASSGVSTTGHVAAELLRIETGISPIYVHYKGSAESQRAILSGEPKVGFNGAPSTYPLIAAGKLKAYAVTSKKRLAAAPDIPTTAEAGFPGVELEYWVGVLAPAATPPALVARLNRDIVEVLRAPAMREALLAQGSESAPGTPEEFAARIRSDYARSKKEFEQIGLRAE